MPEEYLILFWYGLVCAFLSFSQVENFLSGAFDRGIICLQDRLSAWLAVE
jgi:hypothetical protein